MKYIDLYQLLLLAAIFFSLGFLFAAIWAAWRHSREHSELEGMKDPRRMADIEIALALDALITDTDDRVDSLVCEAAYRLTRADGDPIPPHQYAELDRALTLAYRAGLKDGSQSPSLCAVNR